MFINYDPIKGITINSFRNPNGYANSDVKGLLEDMILANPGCCPLAGSWDAIHDDELLSAIDANDEDIKRARDEIYSAIIDNAESLAI